MNPVLSSQLIRIQIEHRVNNPLVIPKKPALGNMVVLSEAPPSLMEGLPIADQKAIANAVGKPILLIGYDEAGRAELEFMDAEGGIHSIYVNPEILRTAE